MKHAKYLLVLVVALAIAIPVGMTAIASEDDPDESPEVSGSESPEVSESESPEVSRSPGASATPDDEDDDVEESSTPNVSSSPKASATMRPSKTPEREQERENEDEGEGDLEREREQERDAKETPEVSVPPQLEDDANEILAEDDNVTKIEIDEDEGRVEVKYKLRAKLFGFLDVPYELEAQVETKAGETKVETRGPWWLLFAVDKSDEVRDALEADPTLVDATNQGTILSTIIGILKGLAGK